MITEALQVHHAVAKALQKILSINIGNKNAVPGSKWRLLGIRKKSPPKKRNKNRVRTGICAQNTSIFLGHPSPSLHFWVFHPLSKK